MKFWNFKNNASGNPQLFVYGEIADWWGVDSKDFADQLKDITAAEIDVRINSDGGSVFTAQAIYSSLRRHSAKINVYIDGMAASAASVIAMAGDTVYMPENAMMMIHNPLSFMYGNAEEMRERADLLDKVEETLIATYRNKSGLDNAKIKELLDNETYLTAKEAKEYGFVDIIEQPLQVAASLKNDKINFNGVSFDAKRHAEFFSNWAIEPENKEQTMNLETLKKEHPELVAQLVASGKEAGITEGLSEGIKAENSRIQAIEELAIAGNEDMIKAAKEDSTMTAEKLAIKIIKAQKEKQNNFLADRAEDAADISEVKPSSGQTDTEKVEAKKGEVVNHLVAAAAKANNREVK